jgi:hypothetical protein
MVSHYQWFGLVIPFRRATQDGRLITNETQVTHRKLDFPVVWNEPSPLSRYSYTTVGLCHRVVIDSTQGVFVGIRLRLRDFSRPGMYWAQADFAMTSINGVSGMEYDKQGRAFFKSLELIGFHLGTNPAYSRMRPIVITEKMLLEAAE